MTKFWKTPKFRLAAAEWEARLKASGFKDAEKTWNGERVLKQTADHAYWRRGTSDLVREAKLTYFLALAQHITNERRWSDKSDRFIMERTAEGWTIKEISVAMEKAGLRKSNRDTIRYIRRRYEHRWGIRKWTPQQMVSRKPKLQS